MPRKKLTSAAYIDSLEQENLLLEQEVARLRQQLEETEVANAKDNFLTLISHELRTPLTSVNASLELLNDPEVGPLTPLQFDFLQIALNNSRRLIKMMETMFDITRLEVGTLQLNCGRLFLGDVVERALQPGLRADFQAKQINLNLNFERAPIVMADSARLIQIFEQLLSNACKFTPPGGVVEVKSEAGPDGVARVSVSDNGIGVSEADKSRLFDKFFRADHSLTRPVGGSGLGLAITNSLVKLHGSQLQVVSAPGRGTSFSFSLPIPA